MSDNSESAPNPYTAPQGQLTDMNNQAGTLAGLWSRFGASLIDGIILSIVLFVPMLLAFGGWQGYVAKVVTGGFILKIGITIFGFIGYIVVNGYFLAKNGQTIGKKLVGIKIVRTDGSMPPLAHILLRRQGPIYVAQLIPFAGGLLCLIDVLLIFRSSRQCGHDQIADTCVVNA